MSGNTTQAGVDLMRKGPLLPLLLIVGFVVGVIGGSLGGGLAGRRRRPVLLGAVTLLLLVAAGFNAAGLPAVAISGMVLAMGAESTIFEEDGDVRFGLTYVTGSLVKMGQRIASALRGGRRGDWVPFFLLWAGLVLGAIAGAASYARWATRQPVDRRNGGGAADRPVPASSIVIESSGTLSGAALHVF